MRKPWSKRHKRRLIGTQKHRERLETYLYLRWYPCPVYVKERDGKSYLKRIYRSSHGDGRSTICKTYCNRKVRHYRDELANGGAYRRVADFWWMLD